MTVSGGIVEYYGEQARVVITSAAAIVAGDLVELTADWTGQPSGADSITVVGVALQASSAAGDEVAVAGGGVWPLVAAAAVTQGERVKAAASGEVTPWAATADATADAADMIVGFAMADIGMGATGPVKLLLGG